jgi:tetratricopeptide (TPR) repeat protein
VSRSRVSAASAALLGLAFAAVAFGAAGGTELGRTSVVEMLVTLCGAALVAAAILRAPRGRVPGSVAVLLFGALAAVTALSVAWSISPELSFVEAGRTFCYLAVFAGAVAAARLWPREAPALAKALLIATGVVVVYALGSRVFPGSLAANELSARIGEPYGYWNAVGTTAAMAVVPALWLGSRRAGAAHTRALAYPALGLAVVAILLTQSRGALAAALVGAALWFAIVPLRLRSLPVLLVGVLGAAPVSAWALSKDAFAKNLQPLAVKESVAGEFGLLILLTALVMLLAGLAVGLAETRALPPARFQRRIGVAAVAVVCAIPLVLFTSVAFSHRGLGGTINDRLDELTSETASTPGGAGRLTATGSSRGRYWRQAGHVFADRRVAGTGAGTFGIARLRYRKDDLVSLHAHGFIPQTLADLGLVGLAATLALLAAWLASAARATGLRLRLRRRAEAVRRDWTPERMAIVCLALVVLVFGVQSAIDWTWFVPGPAVMAIASAGFVAGRGPVASLARPLATPEGDVGPGRRPEPIRIAAAAAVAVTALLCVWTIWQPEASERASNTALDLIDSGKIAQARGEAKNAHDANPLSPRPFIVGASVEEAAGNNREAVATLEQAALEFPGDPQTWLRLAGFQLNTLDQPDKALQTLSAALYLDPHSKVGRALFLQARERSRQQHAAQPLHEKARRKHR